MTSITKLLAKESLATSLNSVAYTARAVPLAMYLLHTYLPSH